MSKLEEKVNEILGIDKPEPSKQVVKQEIYGTAHNYYIKDIYIFYINKINISTRAFRNKDHYNNISKSHPDC